MALFALLFAANLLVVGSIIRILQIKLAGTRVGKALAFAY